MGAPPVAESSDLSEWQRSADDAATPLARNMPSTATGDVSEADWGSYLIIRGTPSDLAIAAHLPQRVRYSQAPSAEGAVSKAD